MIYCQLHGRAYLRPGETLTLGTVARVIAPAPAEQLILPCPDRPGVWRMTPVVILPILRRAFPSEEVAFLGESCCYVHRLRHESRDRLRFLRTGTAFLILLLGGALGLCWFHSDVDMPSAQLMVYRLVTGQELSDPREVTIPYALGVAVGVAVFYALPSRSRSTPMEVKLSAYLSSMEQAEGEDIPDAP